MIEIEKSRSFLKIVLIDSRSRTYNPHPYLGLYDGYACFRHEPHLATDTLLFQLGNINQIWLIAGFEPTILTPS